MSSRSSILRAATAIPGGARPTPSPQPGPYNGRPSPAFGSLANETFYANSYGSFLARPPATFTQGAFSPFSPTLPVPLDMPTESGRPMPRRWQYEVGYNLPIGEPGTEGYKLAPFAALGAMSRLYSVARACIQLRKAEIRGLEWEILPTADAAKAMRNSPRMYRDFGKRKAEAVRFFRRPDPDYFTWGSFIDAVMDQILVYDALSLWLAPKRAKKMRKGLLGSDLDSMWLINGPTIRPLLDLHGGHPRPPAPAYQQYEYAVPRADLMEVVSGRDLEDAGMSDAQWAPFRGDQLLYLPMVDVPENPYGFPPVERALIPIMSGLQKQAFALDFFREGTVPAVYISPGETENLSPTQIRELQDALNAFAGDPAYHHKIIVLPGGSKVMPQKMAELADQFDEIIMNQVCMAFDVMPMELGITPKVSTTITPGASNQMAKATANMSDRKSMRPTLKFLTDIMEFILVDVCGQSDMRFVFDGMQEEEDEQTATNLLVTQVQNGFRSIDEAREEIGLEPWGFEETQGPLVITQMGPVPLAAAVAAQQASLTAAVANPVPALPGGKTPAALPPGGGTEAKPAPAAPPADERTHVAAAPAHAMAEAAHNASTGSGSASGTDSPQHTNSSSSASGSGSATGGKDQEAASKAHEAVKALVLSPVPPVAIPPLPAPAPLPAEAAKHAPAPARAAQEPTGATPLDARIERAHTAELEALARHLRKGRAIGTWTPKHIGPELLEAIASGIARGMDAPAAIAAAKTLMTRRVSLDGEVHWVAATAPAPNPAGGGAPTPAAHDGDGRWYRPGSAVGNSPGGEMPRWAPESGISSGDMLSAPNPRLEWHQVGDQLDSPAAPRGAVPGPAAFPPAPAARQWPEGGHGGTQPPASSPGGANARPPGPGGKAASIKGAGDPHDPNPVEAEHVYSQMLENFPPAAIAWVRAARWIGPVEVPLERVDTDDAQDWAAAHEPERVKHFAKRLRKGKDVAPGICVQEPGENKLVVVDGHHRYLAAKAAGVPYRTYIGFVDADRGPWLETHSSQIHQGDAPANKNAASQGAPRLPVAAGIAVHAADSGRLLMLQRALTDDDPAAGDWEFPGGTLENGEAPVQAAVREWQEETGCDLPAGHITGQWTSPDGVYAGFVYEVESEADVPIFEGRDSVINPDDPDGDATEALAWWELEHMPGNPALRTELANGLDRVLAAVTATDDEHDHDAGKTQVPATVRSLAAHLHKTGNPDTLRRWYNSGAHGGINWGHPGDFDACVAIAGRYISDPEGYCAERHHEATGQWPGRGAHKTADTPAGVPGLTKRSGMISLDLPPGTITPVPGGVDEHHITIVYLGNDLDEDAFATACQRATAAAGLLAGPLTGSVGGRGTFTPSPGSDGKTPVFAEVDLPGISILHTALADLSASEHTGYHPHVTLAYLDDGDEMPDPVPYTPVTITHLTIHRGNETVRIPLGPAAGTAKAANRAPKAGSRAHWPGWGPDRDTADWWSPLLAAALNENLTYDEAEQAAHDYTAAGHGARNGRSDKELTAAALAFLTTRGLGARRKLRRLLTELHTDGRVIGNAAATAAIASAPIDLHDWHPGDTDRAAAALAYYGDTDPDQTDPATGEDLEDDARADGIATTHLRRVARSLALGTAAGLSAAAIAAAMRNIAEASAGGIALNEILTAAGLAVFRLYRRRRIAYCRWIAGPGSCPVCLANQAAGPIPPGTPFPSGAITTPQHVHCGCAIAPAAPPAA